MKKFFYAILFLFAFALPLSATIFTINYGGNFNYSPNSLVIELGDTVNIFGSSIHPLTQVSKITWDTTGNTPMAGGWGIKTSNYDFVATTVGPDTIYFVCHNHYIDGMKGRLFISAPQSVNDLLVNSPEISVYPNPISSKGEVIINISNPLNVSVKVYDAYGQVLQNIAAGNTSGSEFHGYIDATRLENGSYFLVVSDEKQVYTRKFVVVK